jgi:hypothetical protein
MLTTWRASRSYHGRAATNSNDLRRFIYEWFTHFEHAATDEFYLRHLDDENMHLIATVPPAEPTPAPTRLEPRTTGELSRVVVSSPERRRVAPYTLAPKVRLIRRPSQAQAALMTRETTIFGVEAPGHLP